MKQEFLDKILNTLEDKGDLIGAVFGVISDPIADGRGFSTQALNHMIERLKKWHFVNPLTVLEVAIANPQGYPLAEAAMGAVAGWLINEVGGIIDPKISKLGRATKNIATSFLIGNIIGANLWLPGIIGGVSGTTATSGNGTVTY
jgi:hypothetical protein